MRNNLRLIISAAVLIIGIIVLMNSINLGNQEVSNILKAHGGGMDTAKYHIYLEQSIIKYRFTGAILSLLGGFGMLLTTNGKS